MEGIAITGCQPRPDVLARIAAEREREADRLAERARQYAQVRVEERAAERAPCATCGYRYCFSSDGTRCLNCASDPNRAASPMRVEYRGRVEHSPHVGPVIGVRW